MIDPNAPLLDCATVRHEDEIEEQRLGQVQIG
jgi:hypothetical protein